MVDILVRVFAVLLFLTFAWAGGFKVIRFGDWWTSLDSYGFPRRVRQIVAISVPATELSAAALLAFGNFKVAGTVIIGMLASFTLAVVRARALQGDKLPCGCFKAGDVQDVRFILMRNALLATFAAFLILAGPPARPLAISGGDLAPILFVIAGLALAGWTAFQVAGALKRRESR